jgi:hypothetical protein
MVKEKFHKTCFLKLVESGTLIMNFLVGKLIAKEEIKVF